jgi:hypothetical protein
MHHHKDYRQPVAANVQLMCHNHGAAKVLAIRNHAVQNSCTRSDTADLQVSHSAIPFQSSSTAALALHVTTKQMSRLLMHMMKLLETGMFDLWLGFAYLLI